MEIEKEVYFLKEEVIRLKEENEGLQQDRGLAGEIGKNLLENNQDLERKLEEVNNDYISTLGSLEELKQDNYTLRSRLESEIRANSNHAHDLDDVKEKLRKEFEAKEKSQQLNTEKRISDLRKEIESLQNDLSKHTLVENQLQEKIKKQDEMLQTARRNNDEMQHKGRSRLESVEEYIHLASELKDERDALTMEIADHKDNQERIVFDRNVLKERVEYLEEELQEKARQGLTWFNCLQEARLEAGELKAELENLKADNARRNFGKQGNSLFGEVEDERLEMEKKYGSLRARHEGMVKVHNMTKQHLQRLKNQVATLLQVKSCHADASQIQRLTQALVQKEGEVKMLNTKISCLEKQKEDSNMSSRLMEFHDAFSEFGDKKDYVNFLQLQLEDSKKVVAALHKELQTKTLLHLSETDRLRHTEHQLHISESKVERLNSENIKLRLKIDDLRIKMQSHSQRDPQNVLQKANSSLRKTKSAAGLIDAKPASVPQLASKKDDRENFTSKVNAKVAKMETPVAKPRAAPGNDEHGQKFNAKVAKMKPQIAEPRAAPAKDEHGQTFNAKVAKMEPPVAEPRAAPAKDEHRQKFEQSTDNKELSSLVTFSKVEAMTENYPKSVNALRKSPLSSNSVENEVRIGEQRERKPSKVRFETEPVNIDLSETQNARESATSCTAELLKENLQPEESYSECGNISTVTVKGQKKAPVVINVKKGETKNQCPQQ